MKILALRFAVGVALAAGLSALLYAQQPINQTQFGGTAVTLGQKAMTASIPFVLASDQSNINVVFPSAQAVSQSGTWTVQPGNTPNTTAWLVSNVPTTAGGSTDYHLVTAATTNAANIKASAGQVYAVSVYNNAGYPIYVKLHNTAGTPSAGAGVVATIGVQAGQWRDVSWAQGMAFGTGIGITVLKDITDAGTTAVALSDAVLDVQYK